MEQLKIINVESRKGGVGKTTLALCLARLIRQQEPTNQVIFLDCDLSGTDVSFACKSLNKHDLWKDQFHYVKNPFNKKNPNINLSVLFEQHMTGKELPQVIWADNEENASGKICLLKNKINIIPSDLLEERNQQTANITRNESIRVVYKPSVLYDKMHSSWFLEMLSCLVQLSRKTLGKEQNLFVVIDNSPGYSGIGPAIEEWLTDLGPEVGKFLYTCSPDFQDIEATIESLSHLHSLYNDKKKTAQIYHIYSVGKDERLAESLENFREKEDKIFRKFFNRLADHQDDRESKNYNELINDLDFYLDKRGYFDQYGDHPDHYIALTINQVPDFLSSKKFLSNKINDECIEKILSKADDEKYGYKILFDLSIRLQFIEHKWLEGIITFVKEVKLSFHKKFINDIALIPDKLTTKEQAKKYFDSKIRQMFLYEAFLTKALAYLQANDQFHPIKEVFYEQIFLGSSMNAVVDNLNLLLSKPTTRVSHILTKNREEYDLIAQTVSAFCKLTGDHKYKIINKYLVKDRFPKPEDVKTGKDIFRTVSTVFAIFIGFCGLNIKDSSIDKFFSSLILYFTVLIKRYFDQPHTQKLLNNYSSWLNFRTTENDITGLSLDIFKDIEESNTLAHHPLDYINKLWDSAANFQFKLSSLKNKFDLYSQFFEFVLMGQLFDKDIDRAKKLLSNIEKTGSSDADFESFVRANDLLNIRQYSHNPFEKIDGILNKILTDTIKFNAVPTQ